MKQQSMSLKGGLNMYGGFGERYQSEVPPEGRKVVYLQKNGLDHHQEHANKYFNKGDVLTIKEIYVGRSSSEVEFIEHPSQKFNTVMFSDIVANDDMSNFNPDVSQLAILHSREKVIPLSQAQKLLNDTQ